MPNVSVDRKQAEFNKVLLEAFDQTINDLLGLIVLHALYEWLAQKHNISRDELPYHLETPFEQFEVVFGVKGAQTIGRALAIRLYGKLGLTFESLPNLSLEQYIEMAKKRLAQSPTREMKDNNNA